MSFLLAKTATSSAAASSSSSFAAGPSLVRAYYRPVTIHAPFAPLRPGERKGKPGQEKTPKQNMRVFNKGDVVAPGQFSLPANSEQPIYRPPRQLLGPSHTDAMLIDPFYRLSLNPRMEYKNARLLSSFVSPMGRIKGRAETGLTKDTQRNLGKSIRRAMAMGLMHRWQSKDPFAVEVVPWAGERPVMRRAERMPLRSRLAAMGAPGGVGAARGRKMAEFSSSVVGGRGKEVERVGGPMGSGSFGLVE